MAVLFLRTQVITPYSRNFLKERENIYTLKNFSEYEIKQSLTWRKLFAIQFALQSFAPKDKQQVCREMDNYTASLIIASECNKAQWWFRLAW